jgi:undecaprenyl-diphosphatase
VGNVLPPEAVPLRAIAATVAYSRVHTGVHYPGDAIAGALLGGAIAQITSSALERRFGQA